MPPNDDVDGPLDEPCRDHFRHAVVGRAVLDE